MKPETKIASPVTPPLAPARPIPAKSIAVLPFENLSDDKGNKYFADGMQDLILTKLADIGQLQVASRTSAAKYASHPDDVEHIAAELQVANLLEGSVQKAGNQVLINVQLIDTRTDRHLWAQSYQRTLDNIFGVEGQVAEQIATALKAHLTPLEASQLARAGTHNKEALDAYLPGGFYVEKFLRSQSRDDWAHSLALLKQAVELDPNYAEAWATLALTYARFPEYRQEQREAAQRALQLAPDNADAHRQMAFVLAQEGKPVQALAEAERAVELAPSSMPIVAKLGSVQSTAGKLDASIATYRKVLSMPDGEPVVTFAVEPLVLERRYVEARDLLRDHLVTQPDDLVAVDELVGVELAGWGDISAARKTLQAATTSPKDSAVIADAWFNVHWFARDYAIAEFLRKGMSASTRRPAKVPKPVKLRGGPLTTEEIEAAIAWGRE
ncbi:MAG: hypothetical protein ACREP1_02020 [Rhodanobacteraceae bacterium]